jgi:hypothetical protein
MKTDKEINEEINYEDYIYMGEQMAIVIWVPKDTFWLACNVRFLENGEVREGSMELTPDMVHEARNNYLEVDPTDHALLKIKLTEKGERYLEELKNKKEI